MQIKIGLLPSMLIGYLLGCYFTPYMFFDVQLTQWYNILVYFWIFLWPLALFLHAVFWFFTSGAWLVLILLAVITVAICVALDR